MNLLQIHEPGQTPLPHEDHAAIGIDLGTTHSVVAVATDDGVEVLKNTHGHALVPSVVYYAPDGGVEVGYPAKARYHRGEAGAVASVKRRMHESAVKIEVGARLVTPVEVSAEILRELKHNAQRALGVEVRRAVITVPAYFDDSARAATKDAARLAGLEVLRLINEPTAAALAYGLESGAEGIYAIYDLGGGTFDISLLKLEKGVFQVLSTGGDTSLGGDDFDQAITAWMLVEFGQAQHEISASEVAVLLSLARQAKHELSEHERTTIRYQGKSVTLARDELHMLVQPYVEKSISICRQALLDANLSTQDVHGVVLVGGSTRMPMVRQAVREFFEKEPLTDVNPDEVVAVGAALQAHALTRGSDTLLLDVVPLSLGLETMGGMAEKLIERNSPIPASVTQEFTTYQDGQTAMSIHVLQGEREMAADLRSLAKFTLNGIPPMPMGLARVAVTFAVDADGLLSVTARETQTGVAQTVEVRPTYGISEEEMAKMLLASMEHARADMTRRLLAQAKMEAERTLRELESAMRFSPEILTEQERMQLPKAIRQLRDLLPVCDDRDRIDFEVQQLATLAHPFAQRRMDNAIASALKGKEVSSL